MLTAVLVAVAFPCLAVGAPDLDGGSAFVFVLGDTLGDTDGDGIVDSAEVLLGTDFAWHDTDGDSLPDGYELWNALDPLDNADADEDPDRDGLDNRMEYLAGTQCFDPDSDGDNYWDGIEIERGTDPLESWAFPSPGRRADVNCDGRVDAMDVQLVLNGALGLPVPVPVNTDYNSEIDAADIQTVINAALGY